MSLTTTVKASVSASYTATRQLGTPSYSPGVAFSKSLTPGTATGQNDLLFDDKRTIALSSSENLDLNGVLLDAFGNTLTFVHVKGICVVADTGNTNDVVVGGAASNTFIGPFGAATHTVAVKPGETLLVTNAAAGWVVTPATADLLKIANSGAGTSVLYSIMIWGTSA